MTSNPNGLEYTYDGSVVIYVKTDKNNKPIKITTKESELRPPYHVRYFKF